MKLLNTLRASASMNGASTWGIMFRSKMVLLALLCFMPSAFAVDRNEAPMISIDRYLAGVKDVKNNVAASEFVFMRCPAYYFMLAAAVAKTEGASLSQNFEKVGMKLFTLAQNMETKISGSVPSEEGFVFQQIKRKCNSCMSNAFLMRRLELAISAMTK